MSYPVWSMPLQLRALSLRLETTRTIRGALCGAVAAAIWGLQQPLDKLVFSSSYDDLELLGKSVTRGPGWYGVGFAMHMANGAVFGSIYANLAPSLPLPPPLRGPVVGLSEHLALWPLGLLSDRFHPARGELPQFAGNRAAFAQSTWRHLLFGVVLGELERRANAVEDEEPFLPEATFSSNGHGSLEHAFSGSASSDPGSDA